MTTFSFKKPERYNVRWDCPHCGNSHNWWWEDEFEAHANDVCDMICDRCMEPSKCKGDGTGFYVAIKPEEPKPPIEQRVSDLESLEEDLHNYVRGLEDKVNTNNQLAFDSINAATMRLRELEGRVDTVHKHGFDAINRLSMRLLKLETKLRDAPIVPQRGDFHIDDIDPTVMRVYDGRKWVEIKRDDDENTDEDDGPGWGMYGYEHDEENF